MAKTTKPEVVKVGDEEVIIPTKDNENVEVEAEEETEVVEAPKKNKAVDVIIVSDSSVKTYIGCIYVRQYSEKQHGKDFEALADEFCTKSPKKGMYLKVKERAIGKVEVRYREKADYELHIDKQDPNAPMEDKVKVFDDKNEAVRFGSQKINSTVVVSKVK
jgi:hypothetical protein